MKKISLALLSLLMMCTLTGCTNNDKKDESKDKTEEKDTSKDTSNNEGSISDVMKYMQENGIEYSDDKTLSDFDWAAKEGTSFKYNDQDVYLYRVDTTNSQMSDVLKNVQTNNAITANQNGTNTEYAARVNGNYLLIFDKDAAMDELVEIFNKYKENTNDANSNTDESSNTNDAE